MIKAILIDDEQHCLESLSMDIEKYCPDIQICKTLSSSKDGLRYIKTIKPDLVFLDIEMPWMNGFEMLEYLQPLDFEVIFVTAYDSYAIHAFKVNAIDYLMKPIDQIDLVSAVEKVKQKLLKNENNHEQIQALINQYFNSKKQQKIIFSEKDRQKFINPDTIIYIMAESNYSTVYMENSSPLTLSVTLKSIEDKLENLNFLRIHHSYLLNMDKVKEYVKSDGGYLIMSDQSIVPISRSKKSILKTKLSNEFQ